MSEETMVLVGNLEQMNNTTSSGAMDAVCATRCNRLRVCGSAVDLESNERPLSLGAFSRPVRDGHLPAVLPPCTHVILYHTIFQDGSDFNFCFDVI